MSTVPNQPPEKLSIVTKLAFGAGDLGPAIVAIINGFFLNAFLLDVAGLRPASAGTIFLIVKIWDSINDPIIGAISDRTNTRWGRRRPWLLFGAVPFGVAFFLQWVVPDLGPTGKFFYYLIVAILLDTAFTAVSVPYTSLTPELTSDYDERTSLNSYRFSFSLLGGLIAAVGNGLIINSFDNVYTGTLVSAAIWSFFIIASALTTFAFTKESYFGAEVEEQPGFFEGIRVVFSNRPFLIVTSIYLMTWLSVQFVQANLQLYTRYWLDAEDQFTSFIFILQISAFISLLIWTKVSARIGKKRTYYIGMLFWIVPSLFLYFVQPGQVTQAMVLAGIAGIGLAIAYLIPWSMLPDVIDYDEMNTGKRREGIYYGLFVFLQKLGISLGLALSNFALEWTGYITPQTAGEFADQPDAVLQTLRAFVSLVPLVILLLSYILVYIYPISRERYDEIREELNKRHAAN